MPAALRRGGREGAGLRRHPRAAQRRLLDVDRSRPLAAGPGHALPATAPTRRHSEGARPGDAGAAGAADDGRLRHGHRDRVPRAAGRRRSAHGEGPQADLLPASRDAGGPGRVHDLGAPGRQPARRAGRAAAQRRLPLRRLRYASAVRLGATAARGGRASRRRRTCWRSATSPSARRARSTGRSSATSRTCRRGTRYRPSRST